MDWKEMTELTEQPDEGTFEKIRRRLVWRRALRVGVPVLGVAVAAAVAAIALWPKAGVADGNVVAMSGVQSPTAVAVAETASAAETAGGEATPAAASAMATDATETIDLSALLPAADMRVAQVMPPAVETPKRVPVGGYRWEDFVGEKEAVSTAASGAKTAKEEPATAAEAANAVAPAPKAGEPQPEPYHEDDLLWAPNVITPNGDVDKNRTFSIKTSSALKDFRVHIYNRRGQRIFSSTDQAFVWDATCDGAAVPQGAYVWVATFRDSEGTARSETGTVVVIR